MASDVKPEGPSPLHVAAFTAAALLLVAPFVAIAATASPPPVPAVLRAPPRRIARGVREIGVRVACDEEFRATRDWRATVLRRVEAASSVYEREFDVRWSVVDVVDWKSEDDASGLRPLRDELFREVRRDGVDVVVGFTGQMRAAGADREYSLAGYADFYGPIAVVRTLSSRVEEDWHVAALVHEFGHLLGVWHCPSASYMQHDGSARRAGFDATSRRAVELARGLDFGKGPDGLSEDARRAVAEAYLACHVAGESLPCVRVALDRAWELKTDGRVAESRAAYRNAIAEQTACVGPDDPSLSLGLTGLAWALMLAPNADLDEAERLAGRARLLAETKGVEESPLLESRHILAEIAAQRGRVDEAVREFRVVRDARLSRLGASDPDTNWVQQKLDWWEGARAAEKRRDASALWTDVAASVSPPACASRRAFDDPAPGTLHLRREPPGRVEGDGRSESFAVAVRGPGDLVLAVDEFGEDCAKPEKRHVALVSFEGAAGELHLARLALSWKLADGKEGAARYQWTISAQPGEDAARARRAYFACAVPSRRSMRLAQGFLADGSFACLPTTATEFASWRWSEVDRVVASAACGSAPAGERLATSTSAPRPWRAWRVSVEFREKDK